MVEEEVYFYLYKVLCFGCYKVGEWLILEDIVVEIGMSCMLVCEVFCWFVVDGLVMFRFNCGCVVVGLMFDEFNEVFEICFVLEGLVVRFVMLKLMEEYFEEMDCLFLCMECVGEVGSSDWVFWYQEFYVYIYGLSGWLKLICQIVVFYVVIEFYMCIWFDYVEKLFFVCEEYQKFFVVLKLGDVVGVEWEMEDYVFDIVLLLVEFVSFGWCEYGIYG